MGVRGLTTYIAGHQEECLKPHDLCNCYLVVDGRSLACNLYLTIVKSESAFGGDYDEYYKIVKDFFLMLERCAVTPIVLIDGGLENKKVKTVLGRFSDKLQVLRTFSKGYSKVKFFPLFMTQTFIDVLEDLEIIFVQCDTEADAEIAAVARALNCPVLSNDSDFFIYDVLYIPFSSLHMTADKHPNSKSYYVRCSLYNVDNLLRQFPGLEKSTLPIVATLLGNDYIQGSTFRKFFNHVIIPKGRSLSYTQRKIDGVFHWMQKENPESAIKLILTHLENRKAGVFLKAIRASMIEYNNSFVSESVMDELITRIGAVNLNRKANSLNLPADTLELFHKGKVNSFIIDLINLGVYFSPMQVQEVRGHSSHKPAMQLIVDINKMITPYKKHKGCLQVYLIFQNHYGCARIRYKPSDCLNEFYLGDVLKEPKEVRLKLLCQIVGVDESELNFVSPNWSLFIISYIYWMRQLQNDLTFAHVQALLLTAIANEVVQKDVGYFRVSSKFMKSKGNLLESLKSPVPTGTSQDFEGMLGDVTLYEKLLFTGALIPYRQSDELAKDRAYCLSTIHLFACFQSCLFHIMQLNVLLNYPLPHLKVCDFYSGTLAFNLYLTIKVKPPFEKFLSKLFKDTPNLLRVYDYLQRCLCKYSEKVPPQVKRMRKKGRESRKRRRLEMEQEEQEEEEEEEGFVFRQLEDNDEDNDEDYCDENNMYSLLQTFDNC